MPDLLESLGSSVVHRPLPAKISSNVFRVPIFAVIFNDFLKASITVHNQITAVVPQAGLFDLVHIWKNSFFVAF